MSCGNCSYNCCCRCENRKTCRICKIDRCGLGPEYPVHNLCLDCKHTWKTREGSVNISRKGRVKNEGYMHDKRDIKDRQKILSAYDMKPVSCPFCRKPGTIIGINFRVPKKTDTKSWDLLHKLLISSYDDLKDMSSDKDERFVYFYSTLHNISMHDYEDRWMITNPKNRYYPRAVMAIMFGDDHMAKYYSYPTRLSEYPQFLKEVKNGRKYFFSAKERWRMVKLYLKSMSIIKYWTKYALNKKTIKDVLNMEPQTNVIKHFSEFKTIMDVRHQLPIPKDVLFVICKNLFDC